MLDVRAEFEYLRGFTQQGCKRKTVACSLWIDESRIFYAVNGPSGIPCSNEVGNCGCSHAEPRAIIKALQGCRPPYTMVCTYSPCTTCANIIVDSCIVREVYYETLTEHDKRGVAILEAGGVRVSQAQ